MVEKDVFTRSVGVPLSQEITMPSASDNTNAQSARAHIRAAQAAPNRKDLELTQAENFARLISDNTLRQDIEREIRSAR